MYSFQVLWLDGPYHVTYELEGFFDRLRSSLAVLQVSDSATFTNNCLAKIGQNQPNLEALILDTCREINDAGLAAAVSSCPRLRILEVTGTIGLTGTGWLQETVVGRSSEFLYVRVGRIVDFTNADDLSVQDETVMAAVGLRAGPAAGTRLTQKLRVVEGAKRKYHDCWVEDFDPVFFLPELLETHR
jgi:hypothetical protein